MNTLYRCKKCRHVMEAPVFMRERIDHPEINGPYVEILKYLHCPNCGSEDLEVGEPCIICEEFSYFGLCADCRDELKESLIIVANKKGVSVGKLIDAITAYGDYYHDGL